MGCGLGGDPALPTPDGIPPAGGNGQGGVAGNVADSPAPVAPALITLLQQVLATQQGIVGRLACSKTTRPSLSSNCSSSSSSSSSRGSPSPRAGHP